MQDGMLRLPGSALQAELQDMAKAPPQTVREHISRAVQAAECTAEIGKILSAWAESCATALDLVCVAVQKYMEALPKGAVFSASAHGMYSAPLRVLMRELEGVELALHRAMLPFFEAQRCFSERQMKTFLAEQLCREVIGKCPELRETAEQSLDGLAQEQSNARRVLARGEQCREKLELYIRVQLPALCARLERGKTENDMGIFEMCGAFCECTQNLISACCALHEEPQIVP